MNIFKKLRKLEQENAVLEAQNRLLKDLKEPTPEKVMKNVFNRGIEWYDYKELEFSERINYYNEIQSVLTNKSFMNEYNHFIAEFIKEMAKEMNIDQIKYARFGITSTESLLEHLKEISSPEGNDSYNELNEGI